MKKLYPLLSVLFLISVGLSQKEYNSNDLVEMDNGLFTEKFSDEPITGKVYSYFGEDAPLKKVYKGKLLNGKKEGKWVSYYNSNGRKKYEHSFKNGEWDGLIQSWYENGQKESEGTYKDGKEDGEMTAWYQQDEMWYKLIEPVKQYKYFAKNGKEHGLSRSWWSNGKKAYEGSFINCKED